MHTGYPQAAPAFYEGLGICRRESPQVPAATDGDLCQHSMAEHKARAETEKQAESSVTSSQGAACQLPCGDEAAAVPRDPAAISMRGKSK